MRLTLRAPASNDAWPGGPSRLRKVICELTGGHDNEPKVWSHNGQPDAVQLRCRRCGKWTFAYPVNRDTRSG